MKTLKESLNKEEIDCLESLIERELKDQTQEDSTWVDPKYAQTLNSIKRRVKESKVPPKLSIWVIGCVCYASSHDDMIGIFNSKETAEKECKRLNKEFIDDPKYGETRKSTVEAWGECYYAYEVDVSRFIGFSESRRSIESGSEWLAIYTVPSLGEFEFYPKGPTAVETFKINEINEERVDIDLSTYLTDFTDYFNAYKSSYKHAEEIIENIRKTLDILKEKNRTND